MNKVLHQHGDVVLFEVEAMPEGGKKVKVFNGFVLERGEGTNTHVLECLDGELFDALDMIEKDGILFFKVKAGKEHMRVIVNHAEHGPQTISPNKVHKKVIEQEFDYEQDIERRVID